MGLQYIVRRISIRDAEILSVGKIAEFAKFAGGERRKSPDLASDKQTAQWAFRERRQGQVPLIYTMNPRHGAEDCINNLYFQWKIQCRYFSICFIDSSNIASSEYRLSIIVLYLALSSFSVGTGLS